MTLRDYQDRSVKTVLSSWEWSDRVLLVAPTGSGKTVMAAAVIDAYYEVARPHLQDPVLFLCERLSLVDQAVTGLRELLPDLDIGIFHQDRQEDGNIIVASQQTIESRGWPSGVGMIVIDEAHIQRAAILEHLPAGVLLLGLTATPLAQGMAAHWQIMVNQVTTRELIAAGYLADVKVLTHDAPDISVPVRHWTERAAGLPTIGFAETCEHAFELAKRLPGPWEVCWHGDTDSERRMKIDGFKTGLLQGLLSVDALGRGFDVPAAACLLACRTLRSLSTWLQQLGRVMRPFVLNGVRKERAIVLDCAGNWNRLGGLVEDFWRNGPPPLYQQQHGIPGIGVPGIPGETEAIAEADTDLVAGLVPPEGLTEQETLLWWAASTTDGNIEHIYRQLMALAKASRSPDPTKRANASYLAITGRYPRNEWRRLPAMPPSVGVQQAADISYMAWRRRRGK